MFSPHSRANPASVEGCRARGEVTFISEPLFQLLRDPEGPPSFHTRPHLRAPALAAAWKSACLSAELLLLLLVFDAAGQAALTPQHTVGVGGWAASAAFHP